MWANKRLLRRATKTARGAGTLPFPRLPAGTPNEAMPFDHVVVVMMENHSFDNLLGSLALTRPEVDGLSFEDGNPTDSNPGAAAMPAQVRAFELPDTSQGSDVSQTWQDAHKQINGGRMDGFVRSTKSTQPMGYYTRTTLPFAYSLAEQFTVGNRWFCSLPGPTYPNRRFLLAGTAYGCTVTDSATLFEGPPPNGTIFDQLAKHHISWRNYFSDLPMTMIIPTSIIDHPLEHRPIGDFFSDCREGTLPSVSFVDPRIGALSRIGKPIASLPGIFRELLSRIGADLSGADSRQTEEDPQDMYDGELWAHQVVQAVLDSPNWPRTLLIYTYDEHGGYYDHVAPPGASEPDDIAPKLGPHDPPGKYDLYGPRVPAIVVSPYSKRGGVTNVIHDHTSVLATIEHKWNLSALTARDANANPVMDFLDFEQEPELRPRPLEAPSPTGPSGPVSRPPAPAPTQRLG
jgi:phospholipase C